MRLLKVVLAAVLAALAVTVGAFAVVVLVVGVIAYFLVRWTMRKLGGSAPRSIPAPPPRRARTASDVIDVTATEVRADPHLR